MPQTVSAIALALILAVSTGSAAPVPPEAKAQQQKKQTRLDNLKQLHKDQLTKLAKVEQAERRLMAQGAPNNPARQVDLKTLAEERKLLKDLTAKIEAAIAELEGKKKKP